MDDSQVGIKIAGRNNFRYADDATLTAESGVNKEPLDESEKAEWKSWLKTESKKAKIMASGPITSWQIDEEKGETMKDFTFLGSRITADGDCSQEIKRHLLLGRKAMTNLVCAHA